MIRAVLSGVGHATPANVVANDDFGTFMQTSDEWIVTRSGIRERRWARSGFEPTGECSNLDLAQRASAEALKQAALAPAALDAVVYATISSDFDYPGCGAALLARLGITRAIPVYEVRNHCSGFLYALMIADTLLRSGAARHVLVVGMELLSTGLRLNDEGRNTAVLFGDGGGALVLSANAELDKGLLKIVLQSDGTFADKLGVESPSFVKSPCIGLHDFEGEAAGAFPRMYGKLIFKHASIRMPQIVREIVKDSGFDLAELKLIVPHQANQRIIDMLAADIGPGCKVFSNIAKYGNTTAGSIPLALYEAESEGAFKAGDLICLVAFGAGFSWGAALIRW